MSVFPPHTLAASASIRRASLKLGCPGGRRRTRREREERSFVDTTAYCFRKLNMTKKRGRPRSSARLRADACLCIRVRDIPADAPAFGDELHGILVKAYPDGTKFVPTRSRHDLTLSWADGTQLDVTLFTTTTRPYYGGERRWLSCPNCGERCAKLLSPNCISSPFACRKCWRAVYDSQYVTNPWVASLRRWLLRPPSTTASARRQRAKRYVKKVLKACTAGG